MSSEGRGVDYFQYEEYEPFREDLADRVRASGCLATGPDNQKEWEAAGCVLSHSDELRAFANGIKPLRTNGKFSIYVMKFGQGWEAKKPLAVAMADANGVELIEGGKEFLIYGEQHGSTRMGEGLALPNTKMVKTPNADTEPSDEGKKWGEPRAKIVKATKEALVAKTNGSAKTAIETLRKLINLPYDPAQPSGDSWAIKYPALEKKIDKAERRMDTLPTAAEMKVAKDAEKKAKNEANASPAAAAVQVVATPVAAVQVEATPVAAASTAAASTAAASTAAASTALVAPIPSPEASLVPSASQARPVVAVASRSMQLTKRKGATKRKAAPFEAPKRTTLQDVLRALETYRSEEADAAAASPSASEPAVSSVATVAGYPPAPFAAATGAVGGSSSARDTDDGMRDSIGDGMRAGMRDGVDDGRDQGGRDEEELFGRPPTNMPSAAHGPGHCCGAADVSLALAGDPERRSVQRSKTPDSESDSEYSTTESYRVKVPRLSASQHQPPPGCMRPGGGTSRAANETVDASPRGQGPGDALPEPPDAWPEECVFGPDFAARLLISPCETFGSLKHKLAPLSAHPVDKLSFLSDGGSPQHDSALVSGVVVAGGRWLALRNADGTLTTTPGRIPQGRTRVKVNGHWWKVKFGYPSSETFGLLKQRLAPLAERRSEELAVRLGERGMPQDLTLLSAVLHDRDEVKITLVPTNRSA